LRRRRSRPAQAISAIPQVGSGTAMPTGHQEPSRARGVNKTGESPVEPETDMLDQFHRRPEHFSVFGHASDEKFYWCLGKSV
jgi:hypothetical protein